MKKTEVAYLAGIFDGEGSISIIKTQPNLKNREKAPRYRLTVSVGMACEYIPNLFLFSFGLNEAELAIRFQSERGGYRATQYTEEELAVSEVQRMLLHNLHNKSEVYNED